MTTNQFNTLLLTLVSLGLILWLISYLRNRNVVLIKENDTDDVVVKRYLDVPVYARPLVTQQQVYSRPIITGVLPQGVSGGNGAPSGGAAVSGGRMSGQVRSN